MGIAKQTSVYATVFIICFLLLIGCGQSTKFSDGAGGKRGPGQVTVQESSSIKTADATSGSTNTVSDSGKPAFSSSESLEPIKNMTWLWQCESSNKRVKETPGPGSVILDSDGDHSFAKQRLAETSLVLAGQVCPPEEVSRDIMFIVDVSGSMDDNDPVNAKGGCERLSAIDSVIKKHVGENNIRYSLLTFNGDVVANSKGFYQSEADLYGAVVPSGKSIASVICYSDGDTNYKAALQSARDTLSMGRIGATKEIYFISDGAPDSGFEGIDEATQLKTDGVKIGDKAVPVSIATIMVLGDDQVLETKIASRDAQGNPYHVYVADTAKLVAALDSLSNNEIKESAIRYRYIGAKDWTTVDLTSGLQNFSFKLDPIQISLDGPETGLEVEYEYADSRGLVYSKSGRILATAVEQASAQ